MIWACARLVDAERFVCAIVPETGEDIFGLGGLLRLGRIGPEDDGSIADLDAMAAVFFKKTVQCGRVGEGGCFRDGSIVTLLVTVGRKASRLNETMDAPDG